MLLILGRSFFSSPPPGPLAALAREAAGVSREDTCICLCSAGPGIFLRGRIARAPGPGSAKSPCCNREWPGRSSLLAHGRLESRLSRKRTLWAAMRVVCTSCRCASAGEHGCERPLFLAVCDGCWLMCGQGGTVQRFILRLLRQSGAGRGKAQSRQRNRNAQLGLVGRGHAALLRTRVQRFLRYGHRAAEKVWNQKKTGVPVASKRSRR